MIGCFARENTDSVHQRPTTAQVPLPLAAKHIAARIRALHTTAYTSTVASVLFAVCSLGIARPPATPLQPRHDCLFLARQYITGTYLLYLCT